MDKKKRNILIINIALLFFCVLGGMIFLSKNMNPYQEKEASGAIADKISGIAQNDSLPKDGATDAIQDDKDVETQDADEDTIVSEEQADGKTSANENGKDSAGTSQKTDSQTTTNSNSSSTGTTHVHNWKPKTETIYHAPVLITEAWEEEVAVYEEVEFQACGVCHIDITANASQHMKEHMLKGENGSRYSDYEKRQTGTKIVKHEAVYSEPWTETKTIYTCECGATK